MLVDITLEGRRYKAEVPDGTPEFMWNKGVIIGPPDLPGLGLDNIRETRLHNELFNRGLITLLQVQKRPQEVIGALQAALKVDMNTIMEAYSNARSS